VRHCASRRSEAGSRLIKTGRPHTCNISTKESYPSTEPKLGGWRGTPSHPSCWEMGRSSTTAAPQASSSDASPSPKARSSYKRYTRGLAAITQHLEPLLETPSDKVSTGRLRWPTPLELSAPAKGVSSAQGRPTCLLGLCGRYPSPGLLLCGVWTSSAPCRRHPGATPPLERAVHHRQSSEARNEQAGQQSGRGLHQHLEHPNSYVASTLKTFSSCLYTSFPHKI
jgi:hypothetical protein